MTHVVGAPEDFARDAAAGFVDAFDTFVRATPGGVLRSTRTSAGKVAVVIGGGSGHYPAFAGYVGPGLADAAVLGDVFASPSTRQIVDVARAADRGGGVLLGFGNYAGDVLNFGAAAERLRSAGTATLTLAVTDDVASAPRNETNRRRGVAGDVVVFKIAGAAAEAGYDLDAVHTVASRCNDRTRSFGVAFSGCTLPGSAAPLFQLPAGQMGVGMGIHGEPGVSQDALVGVAELARLLTTPLLDEAPSDHIGRAAVILNGLGSTKYEELFVLWHHVGAVLRGAGLELVGTSVGELVTSLDMAGCSLTLTWLDDELERLWLAPAESAAFRRGASPSLGSERTVRPDAPATSSTAAETARLVASSESRASAAVIVRALEAMLDAIRAAESELGRIDAVAGDGDHGHGMTRGLTAACAAARESVDRGGGASTTLGQAAEAWADRAGGTSGALWGSALTAWAGCYTDTAATTADQTAAGAHAALDAVVRVGGASLGDKTMVDALAPFVTTLEAHIASGAELPDAWAAAAEAAREAAEATRTLTPRIGRARPLAERSLGHRDAGAVSLALCAQAVSRVLSAEDPAA